MGQTNMICLALSGLFISSKCNISTFLKYRSDFPVVAAKANQGTLGCLRPVHFLSFLAWALGSNWMKIYLYTISALFEQISLYLPVREVSFWGFINCWSILSYSVLAGFSKGAICAAHLLWRRSLCSYSSSAIWSRRMLWGCLTRGGECGSISSVTVVWVTVLAEG